MMKKCLLIFCFLSSLLFGNELCLKNKLAEAEPGSYIVTEQNKNFTLIHIHEKNPQSVVIEEVTIPAARFARARLPWRTWFEKGAPGHTSWTMSLVNLNTGTFEESFSFTHQGWINLSNSDSFFTTLLNLQFRPVPENKRRRVGLPPGYNKTDYRPYWNPLLTVDGERIPHIPFVSWVARWPSDGSELSRKYVEIYLPCSVDDPSVPAYPTYFPYWIEVDGKIGSAKVRIVDSGMGARSPKPPLPLRPPELIGEGKLIETGLALHLKTPPYYTDFLVIAEQSDAPLGKTFPLPCQTKQIDEQTVQLHIPQEQLTNLMTPGESYHFLISPKEDPQINLATKNPLQFPCL
ncbi:MAG: hypothetical protein S4CHLAM2_07770 [Chlamydiales bacterium]|nr:hypothetical protein [Chlamydiales bacterium]